MDVPPSFGTAYRAQRAVAERICRRAGKRLRIMSDDHGWLVADRIKDDESALCKMQLGLVHRLDDMIDLYAATIVVPTRNEIEPAIAAIEAEFPGARARPRARGDARSFAYDDVHVLARLGDYGAGEPSAVKHGRFEIQVRTGLQFSWWRATHDAVYKGGVRDWRLERVASQVRGNLEMLDGVLADMEKGADLLERRETDLDHDFDRVVGWLERWPAERRPADLIRFHEAVVDILQAARIELAAGEALLDDEYGQTLIKNDHVTPTQAVVAAVINVRGLAPLFRRPHHKRWVLVTDELVVACPPFALVPTARRARL